MESTTTYTTSTATLTSHPVVEVRHPATFDAGLRVYKHQRVDVVPVNGDPYSEVVQFWYDNSGRLARVTSRRI